MAGFALLLLTTFLFARDGRAVEALSYVEGGAQQCIKCHDEKSEAPVLAIFKTPHGMKGDARSPLGSTHECQSCHGRSSAHLEEPVQGQPRKPVEVPFGRSTPANLQNSMCLECHQDRSRVNWQGSAHAGADVSCASCHTIHAAEDRVLVKNLDPDVLVRENQAEVCFQCHTQQRAQTHRVSSHPFKEGKIDCSDCHSPHGSMAQSELVRPTLNETCYQCHAEKRGPFLWEHAPAREDCSLCHTPHGSNHPALLRKRGPQLCQECHLANRHPSGTYDGVALSGRDPRIVLKNCQNCHHEVHGSNHPSGVRWTR